MNKDIKNLVRSLQRQGFDVQRRNSQHYRVTARNGSWVTMPSTPSDWRSILNVRAKLRRIGASLP